MNKESIQAATGVAIVLTFVTVTSLSIARYTIKKMTNGSPSYDVLAPTAELRPSMFTAKTPL